MLFIWVSMYLARKYLLETLCLRLLLEAGPPFYMVIRGKARENGLSAFSLSSPYMPLRYARFEGKPHAGASCLETPTVLQFKNITVQISFPLVFVGFISSVSLAFNLPKSTCSC